MYVFQYRIDEIVDMFLRVRDRDWVLYYDHERLLACLVCGLRCRSRCDICKGSFKPLRKPGNYKPL